MLLPFQWRVTRYNLALRGDHGLYPLGYWSCFSDVGKIFNGELLTYQQYLAYENAYATSALAFLAEANLDALRVVYLDKFAKDVDAAQCEDVAFMHTSLAVGATVSLDDLADVVRLNLREVVWCKLAAKNQFYLHFGWDLYMYVGSILPSNNAISYAESNGLFVEPTKSPYF